MFIGQLKGDCLVFKPQQELSNPVQVCFPMSDTIPAPRRIRFHVKGETT